MKTFVNTKTCTQMLIAALFIIATKCSNLNAYHLWIGKMCPYSGILFNSKGWITVTCYSMDKARKHCAKWNKSVQKKTYSVIPYLYEVFRIGKSVEAESRLNGCWQLRELEFWGVTTKVCGDVHLFLRWWRYSKIDCSDDCTTLWIY